MSTPYKKTDFKVGQEVVLGRRQMGRYENKSLRYVTDTVQKIGRKYITTRLGKFEIDDGRIYEVGNGGFDLFKNMEDYKVNEICDSIMNDIKRRMDSSYRSENFTPEQVYALADILGIEYKGEDENASEKDEVTISRYEYDMLLQDSEFLNCLEACGVDGWYGYGDAYEMFEESEEQEEELRW